MWKHIQQLRLQERYINNPEFALHLRMISSLAFLPPNDVQNSFDQHAALIRSQYGIDADGVLDYFEDHYVGRFRVNAQRGIPTFPIDFWNMFHRTDDKLPRTNNAVEGWHRGSKHMFLPVILCFGSFSKSYKKRKLLSEWELQNEGGHEPPP